MNAIILGLACCFVWGRTVMLRLSAFWLLSIAFGIWCMEQGAWTLGLMQWILGSFMVLLYLFFGAFLKVPWGHGRGLYSAKVEYMVYALGILVIILSRPKLDDLLPKTFEDTWGFQDLGNLLLASYPLHLYLFLLLTLTLLIGALALSKHSFRDSL